MSNDSKKYSVLFVDDEQRILTALRSIFRRKYNVYIAQGGEEALAILAKNSIDVIVSDQRMPNMLGNELLAKVHKLYPRTMRLLLTGFMDKEAIIKTINEGEIYRFINKPWRNDDIHEIIAEAALASEFAVDTNQEASETKPEPQPTTTEKQKASEPSDQAILMMGNDQELRNQIRRLCKQQSVSVYGTQNIPQAVEVVAARPAIGVSVIELPANRDDALHTINLFKQQRPEMVSIVLTDETDAETAVDLINSGQVFRYLAKPLKLNKLEELIDEAFRRHNMLKNNAAAQQRYKVNQPSSKLAAGLRELFSSFGLLRKQT